MKEAPASEDSHGKSNGQINDNDVDMNNDPPSSSVKNIPPLSGKQNERKRHKPKFRNALSLLPDATNLIIGDSQTRRIITTGLDPSQSTQIWTKPGSTLDSLIHALMNSCTEGKIPDGDYILEFLIFCGGITLAKRTTTVASFLNDLDTLINLCKELFPNAKIRFCDFVPRMDQPDDTFMKNLTENILSKYGLSFLLPLSLKKQDVGPDGTHLNADGLSQICNVFQKALNIQCDDESYIQFHWPTNSSSSNSENQGTSNVDEDNENTNNVSSRRLPAHKRQRSNKNYPKRSNSSKNRDFNLSSSDLHSSRQRKQYIQVSNLVPSSTASKVVEKVGQGFLSIQENSKNARYSKSFIVGVTETAFKKVMNKSFWPHNVHVKNFYSGLGEL